MTFRRLMTGLFVVTISIAALGGLLLVGVQSLGLVIGHVAMVQVLTGGFKTVLCVSASVASIAVFLTLYTRAADAPGADAEATG